MNDKIIINLPVQDFQRSKDFFLASGFELNDELTDENALCFNISSTTTVALLPNEHFAGATKSQPADTQNVHEVLLSIGKDSEAAVDAVVDAALSAGASEVHEPIRVESMYGRSFSDLDGHQWNLFYKS